MKKILDAISEEMRKAFAEAGYDEELGKVSLPTVRTFVNTSATALWQAPRNITKRRL